MIRLARLSGIEATATFAMGAARDTVDGVSIGLPFAETLDLKAEGARLRRDMAEAEAKIEKSSTKLKNPQFLAKARYGVVQENRHRFDNEKPKFDGLAAALSRLS